MGWIVGADEAGYGPNLGPLVIGVSAWHLPEDCSAESLYAALADCVTSEATDGDRVPIADSKRLYQPSRGLRGLERGLWPLLAQLDARPRRWRDLWQLLAPQCLHANRDDPWHDGFDLPLPTQLAEADELRLAARLRAGLAAAGVALVQLRCRAVFPAEFNRGVRQWGSKGSLLSRTTIDLVRTVVDALPVASPATTAEGALVACDKHGGRNRYAALLAEAFDQPLIEVGEERTARSTYRLRYAGRAMEFHFTAGGESCLPVAVASMAAKYLRETAMAAFNGFWGGRVPGLQPTAGYPVDAARFRREIAAAQAALAIDDERLWRSR